MPEATFVQPENRAPSPHAAPEISREISSNILIGEFRHRRPAGFQQFSTAPRAFRISLIQSSARPRAKARHRVAPEGATAKDVELFKNNSRGRASQPDKARSGTLVRPHLKAVSPEAATARPLGLCAMRCCQPVGARCARPLSSGERLARGNRARAARPYEANARLHLITSRFRDIEYAKKIARTP